jgi:hypothetical protein
MLRFVAVLVVFLLSFQVKAQEIPVDTADTLVDTVDIPVDTVAIVDLELIEIPPFYILIPSPESLKLSNIARLKIPEFKPRLRYWRNASTFGITLNQASFSENWRGGGETSIAVGGQANLKYEYAKGDQNFATEVILRYGKLKNKGQLQRTTNDRIFWDNKVSMKLSRHWSFFGSVNFESQFDRGYSFKKDRDGNEIPTLISRFMSPGYLTESFGFEYKTSKTFWLRIGTGTARQTFVLDKNLYLTNPKNFGVTPGQTFRNELAFQAIGNFEKGIATNIFLKSRYSVFANYEKLRNIDQRLDATLQARVNKLVNVTLSGVAVYDDDASDKIQASQALSLGLLFKLP